MSVFRMQLLPSSASYLGHQHCRDSKKYVSADRQIGLTPCHCQFEGRRAWHTGYLYDFVPGPRTQEASRVCWTWHRDAPLPKAQFDLRTNSLTRIGWSRGVKILKQLYSNFSKCLRSSLAIPGNCINFHRQLLIDPNIIHLGGPWYSTYREEYDSSDIGLWHGSHNKAVGPGAATEGLELWPDFPIRWLATYARHSCKLNKYASAALCSLSSGTFVLFPV